MRRAPTAIARVVAFAALAQTVLASEPSAAQDIETRVRVYFDPDEAAASAD